MNKERWINVKDPYDSIIDQYDFPQLDRETFQQIYELVGIHALRKSQGTASHMRSMEIDNEESPENMEELRELLEYRLEKPQLQVHRLDDEPDGYQGLVDEGILPIWPGTGYLFKIVCAPAMRSDTDKKAYKTPILYLLDSPEVNPLNCSDVFKRIGGIYCFNCPSTTGGIGSCCHMAFLVSVCSASYLLDRSVNRLTSLVNIKNRHSFQHPEENMNFAKSAPIPVDIPRLSKDKRSNDPLYDSSKFITDDEESNEDENSNANSNDIDDVHEGNVCGDQEDVAEHVDCVDENLPSQQIQTQEADVRSIASSAPSSYYGRGVANADRFIQRKVAANHHLRIPPVNLNRGKLFFNQSHPMLKIFIIGFELLVT